MSAAEVKILEARALPYRDYPTELKASVIAAIEANGGNVLATAKLFNIPRDTVNYWWQHAERFAEIKHASSLKLVDKLDVIANNTADSLLDHDLSIVSAKDKAAIITSLVGTSQLLKGLPTSITLDTHREELLIVMQQAMESVDLDTVTDTEGKQLPDPTS